MLAFWTQSTHSLNPARHLREVPQPLKWFLVATDAAGMQQELVPELKKRLSHHDIQVKVPGTARMRKQKRIIKAGSTEVMACAAERKEAPS